MTTRARCWCRSKRMSTPPCNSGALSCSLLTRRHTASLRPLYDEVRPMRLPFLPLAVRTIPSHLILKLAHSCHDGPKATLARLGRVDLTSSGEPICRNGCEGGLGATSHIPGRGRQKGSDRRPLGAVCPIEDELHGTEAGYHPEYPPRESSSASVGDAMGDGDASGDVCPIDLGIMDDVSCDEGFELEEVWLWRVYRSMRISVDSIGKSDPCRCVIVIRLGTASISTHI